MVKEMKEYTGLDENTGHRALRDPYSTFTVRVGKNVMQIEDSLISD